MTVAKGHGRWLERFSEYFRKSRNQHLKKLLLDARSHKSGRFRIVDLGGSFAYWQAIGIDFLQESDMEVTCINYIESELKYYQFNNDIIKAEVGDACNMVSYGNNSFDFVHSNSVIEHVGNFSRMQAFANEVRRLAPCYYVQTPYVGFPIDPHFPRLPFYHWLPKSLQLEAQRHLKLGWANPVKDIAHAMRHVDGTELLDLRRFRWLFPDARLYFERFLLLPKSMIAERI